MRLICGYKSKKDGKNSIPDEALAALYRKVVFEGLDRVVFEDGSIQSEWDFVAAMKENNKLFVVINDDDEPLGIAWLNMFEKGMARVHFCIFKKAWGSMSYPVGRFFLHSILNMETGGEYLLDMLVGYVPESNRAAALYARKIGMKYSGRLPYGHIVMSNGAKYPVKIYYITRGDL